MWKKTNFLEKKIFQIFSVITLKKKFLKNKINILLKKKKFGEKNLFS